jgi:hypothetical protein
MNSDTCGTRFSALWGKTGGRAKRLTVSLTVLAGLALASTPVASAASWADAAGRIHLH